MRLEVVDEETAAILRTKTGAERLAIAFGLQRAARRMLRSHLAAEHPDWDEERREREVARRFAGGG
jgi:hypothetical protein